MTSVTMVDMVTMSKLWVYESVSLLLLQDLKDMALINTLGKQLLIIPNIKVFLFHSN